MGTRSFSDLAQRLAHYPTRCRRAVRPAMGLMSSCPTTAPLSVGAPGQRHNQEGESDHDKDAFAVVLRVQPPRGVRPRWLGRPADRDAGIPGPSRSRQEMAGALERAKFDLLLLGDSLAVPGTYQGRMDAYLRYAEHAPFHDPSPLAAILAAAPRRRGQALTLSTTFIRRFCWRVCCPPWIT